MDKGDDEPAVRVTRSVLRRISTDVHDSTESLNLTPQKNKPRQRKLKPIVEKENSTTVEKITIDNDDASSISSRSEKSMRECKVVLDQINTYGLGDNQIEADDRPTVRKTRARANSKLTEENLAALQPATITARRSIRTSSIASDETASTATMARSTRTSSRLATSAANTPKKAVGTPRKAVNTPQKELSTPVTIKPTKRKTNTIAEQPDDQLDEDITEIKLETPSPKSVLEEQNAVSNPPVLSNTTGNNVKKAASTSGTIIDGVQHAQKADENMISENVSSDIQSVTTNQVLIETATASASYEQGFDAKGSILPVAEPKKQEILSELNQHITDVEPMEVDESIIETSLDAGRDQTDTTAMHLNVVDDMANATNTSLDLFAIVETSQTSNASVLVNAVEIDSPKATASTKPISREHSPKEQTPKTTALVTGNTLLTNGFTMENEQRDENVIEIEDPIPNKKTTEALWLRVSDTPKIAGNLNLTAEINKIAETLTPLTPVSAGNLNLTAEINKFAETATPLTPVTGKISRIGKAKAEKELNIEPEPLTNSMNDNRNVSKVQNNTKPNDATTTNDPTLSLPKAIVSPSNAMVNDDKDEMTSLPFTTSHDANENEVFERGNAAHPTSVAANKINKKSVVIMETPPQTKKEPNQKRVDPNNDHLDESDAVQVKRVDTPYPDEKSIHNAKLSDSESEKTGLNASLREAKLKESREQLKKLSESWSHSIKRNAIDKEPSKCIDALNVTTDAKGSTDAKESEKPEFITARNRWDIAKSIVDSESESELENNDEQMEDQESNAESDENRNELLDNEAEEVDGYEEGDSMEEGERKNMEENEIPADGVSLGSEDTDMDDDVEVDESDSFIVNSSDEDDQIDLDSEDFHKDILYEPLKPHKKPFRRIINDSSDENEQEREEVEAVAKQNECHQSRRSAANSSNAVSVLFHDTEPMVVLEQTENSATVEIVEGEKFATTIIFNKEIVENGGLNKSIGSPKALQNESISNTSVTNTRRSNRRSSLKSSSAFVETETEVETESSAKNEQKSPKANANFTESDNELNEKEDSGDGEADSDDSGPWLYSFNKSHPDNAELMKSNSSDDTNADDANAEGNNNSHNEEGEHCVGEMLLNYSNPKNTKFVNEHNRSQRLNSSQSENASVDINQGKENLAKKIIVHKSSFNKSLTGIEQLPMAQPLKKLSRKSLGAIDQNQKLRVSPLSAHFASTQINLKKSSTPLNEKPKHSPVQMKIATKTTEDHLHNSLNATDKSKSASMCNSTPEKNRNTNNSKTETEKQSINIEAIMDRCQAELSHTKEKKKLEFQASTFDVDVDKKLEKMEKKKLKKAAKLEARALAADKFEKQAAKRQQKITHQKLEEFENKSFKIDDLQPSTSNHKVEQVHIEKSPTLKKRKFIQVDSNDPNLEEVTKDMPKKNKHLSILTASGAFQVEPITPPRAQYGFKETPLTPINPNFKIQKMVKNSNLNLKQVMQKESAATKKRQAFEITEPLTLLPKPRWCIGNDGDETAAPTKSNKRSKIDETLRVGATKFIVKPSNPKQRRQPSSTLIPIELMEYRKNNLYRKGIPRQDSRSLLKLREKRAFY